MKKQSRIISIISTFCLAFVLFIVSACDNVLAFKVNFYTIDNTLVSTVEVDETGLVTKPADPHRAGYDFLYWSLQENGPEFDFSTKIEGLTNLYAVWKESPKVTFYKDNTGDTKYKVVTITDGTYEMPEDPYIVGYEFLGWFKDKELTTSWDETELIEENTSVYSKWHKNTPQVSSLTYSKTNDYIKWSSVKIDGATVSYELTINGGVYEDELVKTSANTYTVTAPGEYMISLVTVESYGDGTVYRSTPKTYEFEIEEPIYKVVFRDEDNRTIEESIVTTGTIWTFDVPTLKPVEDAHFEGWYDALVDGSLVNLENIKSYFDLESTKDQYVNLYAIYAYKPNAPKDVTIDYTWGKKAELQFISFVDPNKNTISYKVQIYNGSNLVEEDELTNEENEFELNKELYVAGQRYVAKVTVISSDVWEETNISTTTEFTFNYTVTPEDIFTVLYLNEDDSLITIEKVTDNEHPLINIANPEKKGYVFDHWALLNGDEFTKSYVVTGDVSVKPVFRKLPDAPTNLVYDTDNYKLCWDEVSNATKYEVRINDVVEQESSATEFDFSSKPNGSYNVTIYTYNELDKSSEFASKVVIVNRVYVTFVVDGKVAGTKEIIKGEVEPIEVEDTKDRKFDKWVYGNDEEFDHTNVEPENVTVYAEFIYKPVVNNVSNIQFVTAKLGEAKFIRWSSSYLTEEVEKFLVEVYKNGVLVQSDECTVTQLELDDLFKAGDSIKVSIKVVLVEDPVWGSGLTSSSEDYNFIFFVTEYDTFTVHFMSDETHEFTSITVDEVTIPQIPSNNPTLANFVFDKWIYNDEEYVPSLLTEDIYVFAAFRSLPEITLLTYDADLEVLHFNSLSEEVVKYQIALDSKDNDTIDVTFVDDETTYSLHSLEVLPSTVYVRAINSYGDASEFKSVKVSSRSYVRFFNASNIEIDSKPIYNHSVELAELPENTETRHYTGWKDISGNSFDGTNLTKKDHNVYVSYLDKPVVNPISGVTFVAKKAAFNPSVVWTYEGDYSYEVEVLDSKKQVVIAKQVLTSESIELDKSLFNSGNVYTIKVTVVSDIEWDRQFIKSVEASFNFTYSIIPQDVYTLTFTDGAGYSKSLTVIEGNNAQLPEVNPTKFGFVFDKWMFNGVEVTTSTIITEEMVTNKTMLIEASWIARPEQVSDVSYDDSTWTISWSNVKNATYRVSIDEGKEFTVDTNSIVISNLIKGEHSIKVIAVKDNLESEESNNLTFTVNTLYVKLIDSKGEEKFLEVDEKGNVNLPVINDKDMSYQFVKYSSDKTSDGVSITSSTKFAITSEIYVIYADRLEFAKTDTLTYDMTQDAFIFSEVEGAEYYYIFVEGMKKEVKVEKGNPLYKAELFDNGEYEVRVVAIYKVSGIEVRSLPLVASLLIDRSTVIVQSSDQTFMKETSNSDGKTTYIYFASNTYVFEGVSNLVIKDGDDDPTNDPCTVTGNVVTMGNTPTTQAFTMTFDYDGSTYTRNCRIVAQTTSMNASGSYGHYLNETKGTTFINNANPYTVGTGKNNRIEDWYIDLALTFGAGNTYTLKDSDLLVTFKVYEQDQTTILVAFDGNYSFKALTSVPTSWETKFNTYFTYDSLQDIFVPVSGTSAPTFEANKYFEKESNPSIEIEYESDGSRMFLVFNEEFDEKVLKLNVTNKYYYKTLKHNVGYTCVLNKGINVSSHEDLKQAVANNNITYINIHAENGVIVSSLASNQLNADGSPVNFDDRAMVSFDYTDSYNAGVQSKLGASFNAANTNKGVKYNGDVYARHNVKGDTNGATSFTISGNYATIDASNIPLIDCTLASEGYNQDSDFVERSMGVRVQKVFIGIFTICNNNGVPSGDYINSNNKSKMTVNNLSIVGNTELRGATNTEITKYSGGYNCLQAYHATIDTNNVNIQNCGIGVYHTSYYNHDNYSNIHQLKTDQLWGNSVYLFGSTSFKFTDCRIGHSSGAAIHLEDYSPWICNNGNFTHAGINPTPLYTDKVVAGVNYNSNFRYDPCLSIDDRTVIDNYIDGNSAYFVAYGFGAILNPMVKGALQGTVSSLFGSSILKEEYTCKTCGKTFLSGKDSTCPYCATSGATDTSATYFNAALFFYPHHVTSQLEFEILGHNQDDSLYTKTRWVYSGDRSKFDQDDLDSATVTLGRTAWEWLGQNTTSLYSHPLFLKAAGQMLLEVNDYSGNKGLEFAQGLQDYATQCATAIAGQYAENYLTAVIGLFTGQAGDGAYAGNMDAAKQVAASVYSSFAANDNLDSIPVPESITAEQAAIVKGFIRQTEGQGVFKSTVKQACDDSVIPQITLAGFADPNYPNVILGLAGNAVAAKLVPMLTPTLTQLIQGYFYHTDKEAYDCEAFKLGGDYYYSVYMNGGALGMPEGSTFVFMTSFGLDEDNWIK